MEMTNTKLPLVSIIIPTHNRAKVIPETLDSIMAQTYRNWECIIVDDGSSDYTEEVVLKYVQKDSRFRFYHRPKEYKPGANGARNYGFDVSKGEYIQWFDSDDIMLENFLFEKMVLISKNPEYQSVLSHFTYFEGNRIILKNQLQWNEFKDTVYENMIMGYLPIMTPCILFRKQFLLTINEKYDESILRQQEFEFFSRIMINHPHKIHFIDKSLALVRRNNEDAKSTLFDQGDSLEMNEATYLVQIKLVNLLIRTNKLSDGLIAFFYKDYKKSLSIAHKHDQVELVQNYKKLIEKCLNYKNDTFDLIKFRLGFILMKLIPIDNFFLYYNYNPFLHLFNKYITGNIKRVYKLMFVRGWMSEKIRNEKSKKFGVIL